MWLFVAALVAVAAAGVMVVRVRSEMATAAAAAAATRGGGALSKRGRAPPLPQLRYEQVGTVAVATPSCVEGFFYDPADGGSFYQSDGMWGASALLRVDARTGSVLKARRLPAAVFGEGLGSHRNASGHYLFNLTYKKQRVYVFRETDNGFTELTVAPRYRSREGWGMTVDTSLARAPHAAFVKSDGSATLTWHDVSTFAELRTLRVTRAGAPFHSINELEMVDGMLWANRYPTQRIYVIDPASGVVRGELDVSALNRALGARRPAHNCGPPTANGIAYDAATNRLWVMGKYWSKRVELRVTMPPELGGKVYGGGIVANATGGA